MDHLFSYNSAELWEKSNKKTIVWLQVIGGFYLLVGIAYLFPIAKGEYQWFTMLGAFFFILYGVISIFFPRKYFKPRWFGIDFVNIDHEMIRWSVGFFTKPKELRIEDIESYKVYVGEIHFTTKSGKIVKLPIHKIQDEEKRREFIEVIRSWKKDMDSPVPQI